MTNVADAALLDYPQAFWMREYLWPRGDRKRVFLANAVDQVGAAMFGPAWTGKEPAEGVEFDITALPDALANKPDLRFLKSKRVRGTPPPSTGKIILKKDADGYWHHTQDWHVIAFKREKHRLERIKHAQLAHDSFVRLTQVCEWIADVGVNEDVATFGRVVDGTEVFALPGSVWSVEPVWDKRVAACSFNHPSIHRGKGANHPTYLFLDRDALTRSISSLSFGQLAKERPVPEGERRKPEPSHGADAPAVPIVARERPAANGRKRGRKTEPVWAAAYAKAYKQHREIALSLSDDGFRDWVVKMNGTLGVQASPKHRRSIRDYRSRAERGDFDHYLIR